VVSATEVAGDDVAAMLRDSLRGFLADHWRADAVKDAASADAVTAIWRKRRYLAGAAMRFLDVLRDYGKPFRDACPPSRNPKRN